MNKNFVDLYGRAPKYDPMGKNSWFSLLQAEMRKWDDWEIGSSHCTLSGEEMAKEFDDGLGVFEGKPFTLWTRSRVYFPAGYDGEEWVASVPRHPCDESVEHVGSGG